MPTVALVACVKSKRDRPMPAGRLYNSTWFQKARVYARERCDSWFILSAKHGVLAPTDEVAPYEETLNNFSAQERQEWASSVLEELGEVLSPEDEVVILAGLKYREYLTGPLEDLVARVSIPMEGLGIGEQLQFLNQRNSEQQVEAE
ncbi:hypothetical protein BSZ35_00155 [Salinibacter sp. 10B]|uniref:DUF6884 domain-containing protein n=1 Tax=Salinibacter sp. 10B TaxID=1923971 RepID=UPI000CF3B38B|nr:DUF6884 domain-containing protein [Salinibacter sp. 10B]PQJ36835.1 hypothetical protein BSZ35_00155 [Salinibacter sp. 10B]